MLPTLRPLDGLAGEAWCLADAKRTVVLVYSPAGATITLTQPLTGARAMWFNPRDGTTQPATLAGEIAITKPSAEAWLLLVRS